MRLLLRAAAFAAEKHRDQRRKDAKASPYINHPLALADLLAAEGVDDVDVLCAALLHDTIEDTGTSEDELAREFGATIAAVVAEVTDDKRLQKAARKRHQIAHASSLSTAAKLVKLADKLHNLRDIQRQPPHHWDAPRVRGYYCWAHAVVEAIGPVNAGLVDALQQQFAATLHLGGESFRAVPEDANERARLLEAYLASMARTED